MSALAGRSGRYLLLYGGALLLAVVATPLLALLVPRLAPRLGLRILPVYVLGAAAIAVIVLAIPSVGERVLVRKYKAP